MKSITTIMATLVILAVTSCNLFESSSPSQKSTTIQTCQTKGIVKDFTGLDGCGLLIVKSDGQKLIPVSVPDHFTLEDGQQIMFDYVEEPMANICMAGMTVKVLCIKETEGSACDQEGKFSVPDPADYDPLRNSDFRLYAYQYDSGTLTLDIGYSGCSADRTFNLFASPVSTRSIPPQRGAKLVFPAQMCEAWFRQKICFDVSAITSETILVLNDRNGRQEITIGN